MSKIPTRTGAKIYLQEYACTLMADVYAFGTGSTSILVFRCSEPTWEAMPIDCHAVIKTTRNGLDDYNPERGRRTLIVPIADVDQKRPWSEY